MCRTSNILAKVEPGYGDRPFRDPTRRLLVASALRRSLRGLCRWPGERRWFARRQKSPTRGIMEGKIEVGHGHSAIGIPCAARTHVEQALTSFR